jgi:hypothetical protein
MTVALGLVAGVAVVALVAALLAWRASSKRLAAAGARLADLEAELVESRSAAEAAGREVAEERRRSSEAGARAAEAEQRAGRAESRASSAEAAMEALIAARSPAVVAEIERVRLEREWKEVSGPDAPLPVRWDASLGAALEIELEIIREVTGTPGRLESGDAGPGSAGAAGPESIVDEAKLWMLGSLGCELLRVVARYADEMVVRLHPGPSMAPALVARGLGARSVPDLTSVEMAAKALGVSVSVEQTADGFEVTLSAD